MLNSVVLNHLCFNCNYVSSKHCCNGVKNCCKGTDDKGSRFKQKEACLKTSCIFCAEYCEQDEGSAGRDAAEEEGKSKRNSKNPENIYKRYA